ncbi:MAG TPA: bacitracin ABC transporter ATP-binding protein, partial [Aggregatilineales bacterium]|nr:bacitracin ABC transporter ATP-binding protein [Aggregatilineales bacterium]
LDSAAGLAILQLLRRACDDKRQTIVMVTHDPHAATFADRVVFLKDGSIVRDLAFSAAVDKRRSQEIAAVATDLGF